MEVNSEAAELHLKQTGNSSQIQENHNSQLQSHAENGNGTNGSGHSSSKSETNQTPTESKSNSKNGEPEVCRDFMAGRCNRGSNCRYAHPNSTPSTPRSQINGPPNGQQFFGPGSMFMGGPPSLPPSGPRPKFCHDFQNRVCNRKNCRFTHGNRQDEEHFEQTGRLPIHLIQIQYGNPHVPHCIDYLSGKCNFSNCKYRHLTMAEVDAEKRNQALPPPGPMPPNNMGPMPPGFMCGPRPPFPMPGPGGGPPAMDYMNSNGGGSGDISLKRPRLEDDGPSNGSRMNLSASSPSCTNQQGNNVQNDALHVENRELRQQVQRLSSQNAELQRQHDILIDENSKLRVQLQTQQAVNQAMQQTQMAMSQQQQQMPNSSGITSHQTITHLGSNGGHAAGIDAGQQQPQQIQQHHQIGNNLNVNNNHLQAQQQGHHLQQAQQTAPQQQHMQTVMVSQQQPQHVSTQQGGNTMYLQATNGGQYVSHQQAQQMPTNVQMSSQQSQMLHLQSKAHNFMESLKIERR